MRRRNKLQNKVIFILCLIFCTELVYINYVHKRLTQAKEIPLAEVETFEEPKYMELYVKPEVIKEEPKFREVNAVVTFYCACKLCCGENARGITASGKLVSRGMVAAPYGVPFGTKIEMDGLGKYIVEDRGNPRYIKWIDNNTIRIDIYVEDHQEALNLGVVKTTCKIFE
jgi:3D (Asp-Asp-Asp) domain-containing protein